MIETENTIDITDIVISEPAIKTKDWSELFSDHVWEELLWDTNTAIYYEDFDETLLASQILRPDLFSELSVPEEFVQDAVSELKRNIPDDTSSNSPTWNKFLALALNIRLAASEEIKAMELKDEYFHRVMNIIHNQTENDGDDLWIDPFMTGLTLALVYPQKVNKISKDIILWKSLNNIHKNTTDGHIHATEAGIMRLLFPAKFKEPELNGENLSILTKKATHFIEDYNDSPTDNIPLAAWMKVMTAYDARITEKGIKIVSVAPNNLIGSKSKPMPTSRRF